IDGSTLRARLISEAYRLVQKHGLTPSGGKVNAAFAEAEWLAGWIALRFLQDAASAEAHFRNMYEAVRYPVSRARGAYWTARAIEAASGSRNVPAASTWHRLAALHPTTYYGQLSHARLNPVDGMELADKPEPLGQETETFNGQELVHAVRMLADIDALEWLRPFIFRLDGMKDAPGWRQLTLELAETSGRPDLALKIAKREGRESWKFTENAFPTLDPPALPAHLGMPPPEKPLVLAVVRQESAFDLSARSHANAQGLMQLMPKTASRVARNLNLSFSKKRLVSDAKYNLTLGQAYLAGLLKDFKGSYVLALAAYNAGPKRVHQWLRQFGDLRKPEVDSIDWVESIPFRETRNYVQRVLENLQVYRFRLADTEIALRLKDDLHQ
ncbi:MAG: lytic transglycosylase domain-containing protein, partial [Alphaproteobacteria bacterium]|nr:lytic transglycosylase domain-containing protein [Alphaproteobacteria bacterium]